METDEVKTAMFGEDQMSDIVGKSDDSKVTAIQKGCIVKWICEDLIGREVEYGRSHNDSLRLALRLYAAAELAKSCGGVILR